MSHPERSMDIPADVLEDLKCSSCEGFLSRSPVYLQHDGAGVCGQCYAPEHPATRNTQYEALAKLMKYPCKNQDLGCRETVPFIAGAEESAHEAACEHRRYVCPVLGSARCDWVGPRAGLLAHCRADHPDRVLEHPCRLTHDITRPSLHNYIISALQLLFLLHTKVCVDTGKVFHAVRLLGGSNSRASDFTYTVDVRREDVQLTMRGQVAAEGCLAIQEDSSLALTMNSLLDVLGGFDGTTFTVTVQRRASAAAEQRVTCAGCGAGVTGRRYRDEGGWRCERCAPAKRACLYQAEGCAYTDINVKCWKHEEYFCQQRTWCWICDEPVSRGGLSAHYASRHQDFTHESGSKWRLTRGGWRLCLVSSVAGTAVCSGGLSNWLYHVWLPSTPSDKRRGTSQQVLIRVYGQMHGERALEALITESVVFTLLSERNLGPRLHGVFPGGRIEEYIAARPLKTHELREARMSACIATKMAQVHMMEVPLSKEPRWLWDTMHRWQQTSQKKLLECEVPKSAEFLKKIDFTSELNYLKKIIALQPSPVVFCHNDFQEGNILLQEEGTNNNGNNVASEDPKLVLIDFEYCSYNYRGFDIANHMLEWTYDYTEPAAPFYKENRSVYPTEAQQLHFIHNYLSETGSKQSADTLLAEIRTYSLASHLFWGLWSIVNAGSSQITFGYWEYATSRLGEYLRLKDQLPLAAVQTTHKRKLDDTL